MILRDRNTGEIITPFDIMEKFHNTSFPRELESWNQSVLDFAEVDIVIETEKPEDTDEYFFAEKEQLDLIDGVWYRNWEQKPKYTEEEFLFLQENITLSKWKELRKNRDELLNSMDNQITRSQELIKLGNNPYEVNGAYDEEMIYAILVYKENLRQLPNNISNINDYVLPESPLKYYENFKNNYIDKKETEKKLEKEKKLEIVLPSEKIVSIEQLNDS